MHFVARVLEGGAVVVHESFRADGDAVCGDGHFGHTRVRCELVDHGEYGAEARILHNEEHYRSHTFAPWHCIPFSTPRAAAIHWAENERKAIEKSAAE